MTSPTSMPRNLATRSQKGSLCSTFTAIAMTEAMSLLKCRGLHRLSSRTGVSTTLRSPYASRGKRGYGTTDFPQSIRSASLISSSMMMRNTIIMRCS